jgi:hypothetical protein
MTKPRCKAITEKGTQCEWSAVIDGYCTRHFCYRQEWDNFTFHCIRCKEQLGVLDIATIPKKQIHLRQTTRIYLKWCDRCQR